MKASLRKRRFAARRPGEGAGGDPGCPDGRRAEEGHSLLEEPSPATPGDPLLRREMQSGKGSMTREWETYTIKETSQRQIILISSVYIYQTEES
jgi:hypothetical protein